METIEKTTEILGLDDIDNVEVADLVTEDVNLIFLGTDCSGSMDSHVSTMRDELAKFKQEIGSIHEADSILVARANFSDKVNIGGYQKIADMSDDYDAYGMTVLYDAIVTGGEALLQYMEELKSQGVRARAVFAIFSDGEDTASRLEIADAKDMVSKLNSKEIVTAYMEFGDVAAGMGKRLGFRNIMKTGGSGKELQRMFGVLTTSVTQFSQSVNPDKDAFFV